MEQIYGYIDREGTFHISPWGTHEEFAYKIVKERYHEEFITNLRYGMAQDFLIHEKGWILLHSPGYTELIMEYSIKVKPNEQQANAVFDYYYDFVGYEDAQMKFEELSDMMGEL